MNRVRQPAAAQPAWCLNTLPSTSILTRPPYSNPSKFTIRPLLQRPARMINGFVRQTFFLQMAVCGVFVCSNKADFVRNRFAHESPERIESGIFDHLAGAIAFARDCAADHVFLS